MAVRPIHTNLRSLSPKEKERLTILRAAKSRPKSVKENLELKQLQLRALN